MSFTKGVSSFIERLSLASKIEIHKNASIERLQKDAQGYLLTMNDEAMHFDNVILSIPSYESAALINVMDTELSALLSSIDYSPISIIGFGYNDLEHDLDGFGLLTTTSAQKEILGVLWDSSIFNDRAPQGKKSVRVMIGGQRNPTLALQSDEKLIEMARKGIKETMGVDTPPNVVFVERYEKGIPSYVVGHGAKMTELFRHLEKHQGLYLNSNAYFGVGLNDCVSNSKNVLKEWLKHLNTREKNNAYIHRTFFADTRGTKRKKSLQRCGG